MSDGVPPRRRLSDGWSAPTTRNLLGLLLSVVLIVAFVLLAMAVGSIGSNRPGETEPGPRLTNQTFTGALPTAPPASSSGTVPGD